MGLLSWLTGKSPKPRSKSSAAGMAFGLSQAVLQWCSRPEIDGTRAALRVPADAGQFDEELLYLYVFLTLTSVEAVYRDDVSFGLAVSKAFTDYINAAIEGKDKLDFGASLATMQDRYIQYHEMRVQGAKELFERLPSAFLITSGAGRSDLLDDADEFGVSLLATEILISEILKRVHKSLTVFRMRSRDCP